MAGYTSGKFGLALCDQCGQQFKLNQLKKEWTGFKVCDECYEPKHPQLEPKRTLNEPQALLEPRPEGRLGVNVYVGDTGDTSFASIGMQPMAPARNLVAGAMLGTVTTSIT
jgi:hypothetical protein